MTSTGDPSSNANISDYTGGHLNWLVETVDFDTKELHCVSTQNFTKNANYHGGYLVWKLYIKKFNSWRGF